jgi:HlyD family secretion protein
MKVSNTLAVKFKPWQNKWLRAVLGLILLVAAGGAAWYFLLGGNARPVSTTATNSGPDYHTTTVRRSSLRVSATGSGTLTVRNSVDLSFPSKGTVAELNIKLGDNVNSGEILARLGNTESLQANVTAAKLLYLQTKKSLDDLQENAPVSLAQAYQDWVSAQEAYNTALKNDQRMAYARCSETVNVRNATTLDRAKKNLDDLSAHSYGTDAWINAESDYETALSNYQYCITYTTDEKTNAKASQDLARVTMNQAETKYNTLKSSAGIDPTELSIAEAKVTQTETHLAQVQKELDGSTLVAPMDGTVVYLASKAGTFVDTSKYITISDLSEPMVQISVDQADLDKLAIGNRVEVVFDSFPDQTLNGNIIGVDPQLSSANQSLVARGLVQLDEEAAKALQNAPLGLSATVDVTAKEVNNGLLIPIEALRDLGNKDYGVFVLDKDGKLRLKPVEVGVKDTTRIEILSGLNEGEVVSTGLTQSAQ